MSEIATSTFLGVLVAVFLAIKFWRMVLGLMVALMVTLLIMGLYQMVTTVQHTATNLPAQSHVDGGRG